jgi:hypothetical protein
VAKRSPILGYNHNVRHRGLVFHVQTEDSGVQNPHIFTHAFHGGVILSSRRLNYDSGSSEESVKSLMQAQHKALLKDLKNGVLDDKIDEYLGGNPALEPAPSRMRRDTLLTPPPPEVPEAPDVAAGTSLTEAVTRATQDLPPLQVTSQSAPRPPVRSSRSSSPPPVEPSPVAAPRRATSSAPPPHATTPLARDEDDIAEAFRAISMVELPVMDSAVPVATYDDDGQTTPIPSQYDERIEVLRITPPARPAVAPPASLQQSASDDEAVPEVRISDTPSGSYSQHRSGRHDMIPLHEQPTAPVVRPRQRPGAAGAVPMPSRRGSQPPQHQAPIRRPAAARSPASRRTVAPTSRSAGPSAPRSGVVVSRPAVIVGGPPKVVGGRVAEASGPRPPATRRAREEPPRASLFGKDLISEKSLDEVILAYLSEDSSDEQ